MINIARLTSATHLLLIRSYERQLKLSPEPALLATEMGRSCPRSGIRPELMVLSLVILVDQVINTFHQSPDLPADSALIRQLVLRPSQIQMDFVLLAQMRNNRHLRFQPELLNLASVSLGEIALDKWRQMV